LVANVFATFARLRSARVFHPDGAMFTGTLAIEGTDSLVGSALAGVWPIHVRASKGIGTPGDWPDLHGLAVRIHHDTGPVDLLFVTVVRHLPYVLAPSVGWCSAPYSTFLPYEIGDSSVLVRLEPAASGVASQGGTLSIQDAVATSPVRFTVLESSGLSWRPLGKLDIERPSDDEIAFDPVRHQHPGMRHVQILGMLRARAYAGSRRGRRSAVKR
jgi:hypothetical protein